MECFVSFILYSIKLTSIILNGTVWSYLGLAKSSYWKTINVLSSIHIKVAGIAVKITRTASMKLVSVGVFSSIIITCTSQPVFFYCLNIYLHLLIEINDLKTIKSLKTLDVWSKIDRYGLSWFKLDLNISETTACITWKIIVMCQKSKV